MSDKLIIKKNSLLTTKPLTTSDKVVVNIGPKVVVNTVVNSRSKDRHTDKTARRAYLREYMRAKRAREKTSA